MTDSKGGHPMYPTPVPTSAVQPANAWRVRPARFAGTRVALFVDETIPGADLHAGIIRLAPGARIPVHWHEVGELQFVLSGSGLFIDDRGRAFPLSAEDAIYRASGPAAAHGFANDSVEDLVILFAYPSPGGSPPALDTPEGAGLDDP